VNNGLRIFVGSLLLFAAALITGCAHGAAASAAASASNLSAFSEESVRAVACLDGLSRLELSGDIIYKPQEARCAEHISYIRQVAQSPEQKARAKMITEFSYQIDACHASAPLGGNRFGKCLDDEVKLRDKLGPR
jgi:hypothetical protein